MHSIMFATFLSVGFLLSNITLSLRFFRGMMNHFPLWLWRKIILRMASARCQVSFLPLDEDRSKVKTTLSAQLGQDSSASQTATGRV